MVSPTLPGAASTRAAVGRILQRFASLPKRQREEENKETLPTAAPSCAQRQVRARETLSAPQRTAGVVKTPSLSAVEALTAERPFKIARNDESCGGCAEVPRCSETKKAAAGASGIVEDKEPFPSASPPAACPSLASQSAPPPSPAASAERLAAKTERASGAAENKSRNCQAPRALSHSAATAAGVPTAASVGGWRVSERCRLVFRDLTPAFDPDAGTDNFHNSRTAQSGYCQEAFRANKAHPGDYLRNNRRLTAEARDLIVCILHKVASHLSTRKEQQQQSKRLASASRADDPLEPREAATLGVAVQLFDRFMAVLQQADLLFGAAAEHKAHPLRGVGGSRGTNALLLTQLVAIVCFGCADRMEAINAVDYSAIVESWKMHTVGMLKSAWPTALSCGDALRAKLLQIERVLLAYLNPSGNVAVPPTSELAESLLNVGFLFATSHFRRSALGRGSAADSDAPEASLSPDVLLREHEARVAREEKAMAANAAAGRAEASLAPKEEEEKNSPFVIGQHPRAALGLRVSGRLRVDIPRQVAHLLVRLSLADSAICLHFKPSTVAAAAAQLALFDVRFSQGASDRQAQQEALAAASAAIAATGCTANFRLVRACQFRMLRKWSAVSKALLAQRGGSGASSGTAAALPEKLFAEWLQRRLCLPHHRDVLLALERQANMLNRYMALDKQLELRSEKEREKKAVAGGIAAEKTPPALLRANKNRLEKTTGEVGAEKSLSAAAFAALKEKPLQRGVEEAAENRTPSCRPPLQEV